MEESVAPRLPKCEKINCKIHKLESGKFDLSQGIVREFCFVETVDTLMIKLQMYTEKKL